MTPGTIVRFRAPVDEDEQLARYTVIEDRGPRVLVCSHPLLGWDIEPTFVFATDELTTEGVQS